MAIPRLVLIISQYPRSAQAVEARYWLGRSYQELKSYREAANLFNEYLAMAPEGEYAEEARLAKAQIVEEYEQTFSQAQERERRILDLERSLDRKPGDVALQLELADLLWRQNEYERAGAIYYQVVQARPEFMEDAIVSSRLALNESGYTVITPAEFRRRDAAANPLQIVNQSSFRSGHDLFTREAVFYVVTGQAYNRSNRTLFNVQVHCTIYGFGNMIYDSNTVFIGELKPGERRAFSTRFSNFDDINNITRYECVGSYDR